MIFINWPRSTVMRFAYMMPELLQVHTGKVVNTAGIYEEKMAPWAYWNATLSGWEEQGFKNSGKNRMRELISEYGGPAQLYYGIMDTQGLEVLMTRNEWKAQEKYWLQYCIDNGKWPFSVWLVPEDITVLEDITDNNQVTAIIDSMRTMPVKQHTLEGWLSLSPGKDGYMDDESWEKMGAGRWESFIDREDKRFGGAAFVWDNGGSNIVTHSEDKKMEYLYPWNLQMEKIEDLTRDSWKEVLKKARGGRKNSANMSYVSPEFRRISNIYTRILQEYERANGKLVGFGPYPN